MPRLLIATLAAAALAAPAAAPVAAQQRTAPVQRDWSTEVVATPEGGFRMGNPNARVKVVEYLSLTCPHCAEFAHAGAPSLIRDHVRSGRVSLEYRNYVLNGYDLAAALLSRCAAPQHYFALNHAILGSQEQWMGRVEALTEAQRRELRDLEPVQSMPRIVALTGLDALAARHGLPAAAQRSCLADQAALERIITMRQAADALGVAGTPTFLINGTRVDVNSWPEIQNLIRRAGG